MKAEIKDAGVAISVEPLAVHIDVAAQMIGLSRTGFYEHFIKPHRVVPVYVGHRAMVDVAQLRAAWSDYLGCPQAYAPTRPVDPAAA